MYIGPVISIGIYPPGSKNVHPHHLYDSVMAHLEAGLSITAIHHMTGVSRGSISKWRDDGR
ncbi:hypothetical protein PEPS_47550 (plasmid) [Persicobacter psychrovividus]|uniref:Helix-turn-helix domain-containing protein n=1 Tax=Persicobacter psychrovividus TaxID=387638 RepID=A0ABN6LH36_9BACT|nr:hypothetical protein PEPS_47550 [Persicobacter psychrovividus]